MHPLGQLIERYKTIQDPPLTNADVARRMGKSRQRVQQLINDPIEDIPPVETLRELSRALRAPLIEVVSAVLDTVGLPYPSLGSSGDPIIEEILRDEDLPPDIKNRLLNVRLRQREEVQMIKDTLVEAFRASRDTDDTPPDNMRRQEHSTASRESR